MPQRSGRTRPTVLLRHAGPAGQHYDWLLGDPMAGHDPAARLWTARTDRPSRDWPRLECWDLTPLPAHRARYLAYQGQVAGRGSVTRIDQGWFIPLLWTPSRAIIDLQLCRASGIVELARIGPACWRARWRGSS